ncbi:MAG: hypothetical protein HOH43_09940 [Candidatus Latescibacteria bacterium]|nr:hypothetical protein [Candidatus Latescibacterota bacterium]
MTKHDNTANVPCYSIYGLNVASDIALPAAALGDAVPDVYIRYGKVPQELDKTTFQNRQYQITQNCILVRKRAARFLVCRGSQITIDPAPQATEAVILYRLLQVPLMALLYQRRRIVLHGSAICVDGKAVVFMGQSGRGKSTLAAAFRSRQYPLLSDDICVVSLASTGKLLVVPGYPQIKIHRETARQIGISVDDLEPLPVDLKLEKYTLETTDNFVRFPIPLRAIFEIDTAHCDETRLTPLHGYEKQFALIGNTFLPGLVKALGREQSSFQQYAEAFRDIPLKRVNRPDCLSKLDSLVERLEGEWQST